MPRPVITGMSVNKILCGGNATINVTVNNYGETTAFGTLKVYIDGNEKKSLGIQIDPYNPTTFALTIPMEEGEHTIEVVLMYPGGSDSMSRTVTFFMDSDCDYLIDQKEREYGLNPNNPDTDGDGVIDSRDMNPVGNYEITVYILRARALDDVDSALLGHNPADMNLTLTVNGQTRTLFLTNDQDDKENKILPTSDPSLNLEDYAIAKATFNVPDDETYIPITFHLYDREGDKKGEDIDVSPGPGTVATIYYNMKTGTWSGDDYPEDEERYFGYGHLSGCGDGSCGVTSREPEKDLKVYAKYESIMEEKGIKGEVMKAYSLENVSEVRLDSRGQGWVIRKPKRVTVAEVRLENGSVVNVTLVNTHNAKVLKVRPGTSTGSSSTSSEKAANTTTHGAAPEKPVRGRAKIVPARGNPVELDTIELVTYSSQEEHDGEIWFVIVPDEPDGIPFWREVELNKELEASGISERFDPSDAYLLWDYEPWIAESLNEMDELGDYDGDGVPNAVEVLIGKDPAKRDILGIELTVSVEWDMSEEDKENLAYSIRKASDFVYDYTDGYAMITKITVWDDKRNWDKADVRVYNRTVEFWERGSDAWPQASIGGYWIGGRVMMPKKYQGRPGNSGSIGDVSWGRTLGHELGHYVFWLGDEYEDWHEREYQIWYAGTLHTAAVISSGIRELIDASIYYYYELKILSDDFMSIHSVMNKQWEWSELSTPKDYEKFKKDANELWDKTSKIWELQGYNSPEDMLTYQWRGRIYNGHYWNCSAWKAVYSFLSGHDDPEWIQDAFKPENNPRRQRILLIPTAIKLGQ